MVKFTRMINKQYSKQARVRRIVYYHDHWDKAIGANRVEKCKFGRGQTAGSILLN